MKLLSQLGKLIVVVFMHHTHTPSHTHMAEHVPLLATYVRTHATHFNIKV